MKAKKELPFLSRKILGIKAEIWENVWDEIKDLERIYGSSEVIGTFEAWAGMKKGEVKEKPISEFLKVADGLLMGTITLSADPTLTQLIDDLVYACGGDLTFDDSQTFTIGRLLEAYSPEEILSAGREFYATVKDDAFKLKNAPKHFVEKAEQLIKFARRTKKERAVEETLRDAAKLTMQAVAEEERRKREKLRAEDEALIETELPD